MTNMRAEDGIPRGRPGIAKEMLFDDLADMYLANRRKNNGAELRAQSKRGLRQDIAHLKKTFGGMKLEDVTVAAIAVWYYGPHDEGRWVFPRLCMRLKSILEEACRYGTWHDSPLLESNPFVFPVPPTPEPTSWKVPPLTGEQLLRLYELMPEYTRLSVLLSAWAGGIRIGEACALKILDVDIGNRVMFVDNGVCRDENDLGPTRLGPTKSARSRRACPLPDVLIPLVRQHIETQCAADNPMLFQARRGRILATNTLNKQFRSVRDAAGCPNATFRTLRMTHATMLLQHGATVREVMDSLGDSTQEVVMRHYLRTIPEHQREVSNRMAASMYSEAGA